MKIDLFGQKKLVKIFKKKDHEGNSINLEDGIVNLSLNSCKKLLIDHENFRYKDINKVVKVRKIHNKYQLTHSETENFSAFFASRHLNYITFTQEEPGLIFFMVVVLLILKTLVINLVILLLKLILKFSFGNLGKIPKITMFVMC